MVSYLKEFDLAHAYFLPLLECPKGDNKWIASDEPIMTKITREKGSVERQKADENTEWLQPDLRPWRGTKRDGDWTQPVAQQDSEEIMGREQTLQKIKASS